MTSFKKSVVREYFESIVIAVILALFVRTWVVQAFKIPTGSMENNLLIGDHLLVNKFVFGPTPLAIGRKVLPVRPIARGDIVVFKYPDEPDRDFIKRVIGLPGETVEIRNKTVFINGQPLEEAPYVHFLEPPLKPGDPEYGLRGEGLRDNWGPQTVPPGKLFVLGDNRDNSRDSRFPEVGFVPAENVVGKAVRIWLNWNLPHAPLWGRVGEAIH